MRPFATAILTLTLLLGVALAAAPPVQAQEEEEEQVVLTLEKVTAPFDKKAVIEVEQKDGKFKKFAPKDHKTFDKQVDDDDLEITEYHIKDRKIVKIVFAKKVK